VWSFSGRPDVKFKVQLIHRSVRFCITTTSILTGATYTRVRLIVEILWYIINEKKNVQTVDRCSLSGSRTTVAHAHVLLPIKLHTKILLL